MMRWVVRTAISSLDDRAEHQVRAEEQEADQEDPAECRGIYPSADHLPNAHAGKGRQRAKDRHCRGIHLEGTAGREASRQRDGGCGERKPQHLDQVISVEAERLEIRNRGYDEYAGGASHDACCRANCRGEPGFVLVRNRETNPGQTDRGIGDEGCP